MNSGKLGWLALAIAISGCRGHDAPPYPVWAERPTTYAPAVDSPNAFDAYVLAARSVEQNAVKYVNLVSFFPRQKREATAACADGLKLLKGGVKKPCAFHATPRGPLDVPAYQRGWRLLGRCLVWDVQRFAAAGDFPSAIRSAIIATKFGFDLTGGAATDASLGFAVVDETRQAIAPYLRKFSADQLHALAEGVKRAVERKPPLADAVQNEEKNMLMAVQFLQDCYREDRYKDITAKNDDLRELATYLKDLHNRDHTERPEFFGKLAEEAKDECIELRKLSSQPAADRHPDWKKEKKGRPWRRFAQYFFTAGRPLLSISDASIARTRLLILECELSRIAKVNKKTPKSLDGFTKSLTIDPYSGTTFIYRPQGMDYALYSVGANLVDDGGMTDDSFSSPDLRLERLN